MDKPIYWTITVKKLVRVKDMDSDDRIFRPDGVWTQLATCKESALDLFHLNVPIACLDDFEINIEEEKDKKSYEELEEENRILRINLNTCKNDYWFMTNLLERYSSNKEEAIIDCIERMKFRKPLFKLVATKGE